MSTAKIEKLFALVINEDQARAEQLFHEIVVEKSREIYESLMAEDQTAGLVDEISMEEGGYDDVMEDDEFTDEEEIAGDYAVDGEEPVADMEMDGTDMGDMGSEESATKADIMDIEDKLDELLASFEAEFGGEAETEVDFDAEEEEDEEEEGEEEEEEEEEEDEESGVMEAVEMKKVSVTHTDGSDSAARSGPNANNRGQTGMAAKPVKFAAGSAEAGRATPSSQTVGMKFKNSPGAKADLETATKPVTKQAPGVNVKDVVPESKRSTKRRI